MKKNVLMFYGILVTFFIFIIYYLGVIKGKSREEEIRDWIPSKLIVSERIVKIPFSFFSKFHIKKIIEPVSLNSNYSRIKMDVNWLDWYMDMRRLKDEDFQRGLNVYLRGNA